MIVSREGDAVAIYFRMPFTEVAPLFGHRVPGLTNANGEIVFDTLAKGTFEDADVLAQKVAFNIGGQNVHFDALSMMAHQAIVPQAFETPIDAQIAIAVCGVPLPEGKPDPDKMTWIGGWYAYPVDAGQDISISFPETGRQDEVMSLRVYDRGRLKDTKTVTIVDGGSIDLPYQLTWRQRLFGG
ncbi:MAG: hypothetical protein AAF755_03785 [Pseudomonadota bacterium]